MGGIYLLGILFALLGMLVQNQLRNKIKLYSSQPLSKTLTGKEVAETMLRDHGIFDVKIMSVKGQLTDHYNPQNKTVNLSIEIYHGRNIASTAVASHECGHALQHASAYAMLGIRSTIVPFAQVAGTLMPWILMIGVMLLSVIPQLLLVAIIAQFIITLFTLITLPVEFDASKRALVWLDSKNITTIKEHEGAKDALKWAAMTYVIAALAAIAQLIYLLSRYSKKN